MMNVSQVKEVFSDETFVSQLLDMDDDKQVQNALSDKGIDLSIEEIAKIKDKVERYQNNQLTKQEHYIIEATQKNMDGQLSDEQLESVSGGLALIDDLIIALFIGIMVGGGIYETVKSIRRSRW